MIRPARLEDIPAILRMVEELRSAIQVPQKLDKSHAAGFLARLIGGGGLCLVADVDGLCGFLAASVEVSAINPEPVAVEHGWFSLRAGVGGRLRDAFEAWAHEKGCRLARLSSAYGDPRAAAVMQRAGYRPVEIAWVKTV